MADPTTVTGTFHPRMQEDGSITPREGTDPVTPPITGEAAPPEPDATNVDVAAEVTQAAVAEDFYRIGKQTTYADLRRLATEDPALDRTLREYAGRSNKKQWEAELARTQAEKNALERQLARINMAEIPQEEVDRRFAADADFAREYTDLLHGEDDDPDEVTITAEFQNRADDLFDEALMGGMPTQRLEQYQSALQYCPTHQTNDHGFFDHDSEGVYFHQKYRDPAMAESQAFAYFERTISRETMRRGSVTTPAPVQPSAVSAQPAAQVVPVVPVQSAPPVNPALAKAPDMSMPATNGAGPRTRFTAEQVRAMSPDSRIALMEQYGGRQKMIEDGVLIVPGLSESLGYN